MVILVSCCYYFSLRVGSIIAGVWLMFYYSLFTYFMYYQLKRSTKAILNEETHKFEKETTSFWVMIISFFGMAVLSLVLRKKWIVFLFLLGQIVPISGELYYLLVALLLGINFESCVLYFLPFLLLLYIDLLVVSYWLELRSSKKRISVSVINVEY
ncbi:uncharacterized protein LOC108094816 isoform X2 [Drosophila ficusphila]|uniref:uncharacterized protein LOC108094816 isoform X2 n=1 Tax=Drosophila ficusphila TaxID=30025 RepID=UPI0007E6353C|nr:uncharacterized protein LOC108094816 isoform X2 [Drosophila ficusphila]